MPSLNDRVVLLTGGATGIGRAIALDMAAGATVAIGDTNTDDGQRTVEEILSAGGKASRSCDVAEAEQVTALVNGAVADFGRLDLLVNDAGDRRGLPRVPGGAGWRACHRAA
jgi:NAD(P)-dependent dehydrogenase (short-subunit alcohol dehydrogenase family)